jgi:hypothetical protein
VLVRTLLTPRPLPSRTLPPRTLPPRTLPPRTLPPLSLQRNQPLYRPISRFYNQVAPN